MTDRNKNNQEAAKPAQTGNASNPSAREPENEQAGSSQIIGKEGEKYLREAASIEDLPDAEDQQDMDDTIKKEGK